MIGKTIQELTVLSQIGEGGMGAVYLAEDRVLHTLHVVKVLLPQWTRDEKITRRFVNEARAAAAIRSKNIVSIERCFQHDDQWVIVMEYLEGRTLGHFAEDHQEPLSQEVVVELVGGAAAGLSAAHQRNIIHRDLKPENVFVTADEDGRRLVKVLDFGIAKLGEASREAKTRTGMVAGTPAYMAPEQIRDFRSVDARADVYALGVIAYQLATGGRLPFQDGAESNERYYDLSTVEIYERQRSGAPTDPRTIAPSLTDLFAETLLAALEFDPANRPQSARALAVAIAEATPGDGYAPSGVEILRRVSQRLLDAGSSHATIRSSAVSIEHEAIRPRQDSQETVRQVGRRKTPVQEPQAVTRAERPASNRETRPQPSTLGGSAAEVVPAKQIGMARSGRGRGLTIAAAALVTLVTAAGVTMVLTRHSSSETTASSDATIAAVTMHLAPVDAAPVATPAADTTPLDAPTAEAAPPIDAGAQAPPPTQVPPVPAPLPRRPPVAPRAFGDLEILVEPWAAVVVDGRSLGQTPVREKLPAGRHRVRITNDVSGKDETITVVVDPNRTTTIQRSWR